MMLRSAAMVVLPLLLLGPTPAPAKDEKTKQAPPKGKQKDDGGMFLKGSKHTCKKPPLRVSRPNNSWRFVDIAKMKQKLLKDGQELKGFENLQFRLWFGAYKANIYVRAYVDPVPNREKPLTAADLALERIKRLKASFVKPKVKRPRSTKLGKQKAVIFEISGTLANKKPHFIIIAVAYRSQDKAVAQFALEWSGADKKKQKELRKDFKKFLKKAKF